MGLKHFTSPIQPESKIIQIYQNLQKFQIQLIRIKTARIIIINGLFFNHTPVLTLNLKRLASFFRASLNPHRGIINPAAPTINDSGFCMIAPLISNFVSFNIPLPTPQEGQGYPVMFFMRQSVFSSNQL